MLRIKARVLRIEAPVLRIKARVLRIEDALPCFESRGREPGAEPFCAVRASTRCIRCQESSQRARRPAFEWSSGVAVAPTSRVPERFRANRRAHRCFWASAPVRNLDSDARLDESKNLVRRAGIKRGVSRYEGRLPRCRSRLPRNDARGRCYRAPSTRHIAPLRACRVWPSSNRGHGKRCVVARHCASARTGTVFEGATGWGRRSPEPGELSFRGREHKRGMSDGAGRRTLPLGGRAVASRCALL